MGPGSFSLGPDGSASLAQEEGRGASTGDERGFKVDPHPAPLAGPLWTGVLAALDSGLRREVRKSQEPSPGLSVPQNTERAQHTVSAL